LQRATGVLDDDLRPAFRALLTATGDVKKSQDALALALDISAGTGKDLGAVSAALSRGFLGQTTALSRLGAGLDKATLKTGDMDVIIGQLTEKFRGQALAAAEGYAGAIAKLTVASNNAKEIIGKDLLDAMQMVAGKDGIGGATTAIEGFATQIGNAIYGIGVLTKAIKSLPGAGFIGDVLNAGTQISGLGLLSKLGASSKARSAGTPAQSPGQRKAIDKANADALKLQKTKNSLAVIDNENTKRKLTLTADQQALEELKKKFDVERVGLFAALNQATDEETKMRLRSLIAIKDNDAALAGKIKAELEATRAVDFLSSALFRLSAEFDMERARMALGKAEVAAKAATMITGATPSQSLATALKLYPDFGTEMDAPRTAAARGTNIVYNINASGIGDQQIAAVVQGAIQDLNRYGNSITYAGAI